MLLAPRPQLAALPFTYRDGRAGAFDTLVLMRQLVNAYKITPEMRQAATSAVYLTPERDDLHEVQTVFELVRDGVRYVRDIAGVETISTPDKTLEGRIGDCDDKTVLLCTLLEAIGYHTRFVMTGYSGPDYEHVFCQVFIPEIGDWVDADATEKMPLGYAPPMPTVQFIERV